MAPSLSAPAGLIALVVAVAGATGCVTTPEQARHADALDRLDDGLAQKLDRLLLRWSGAAIEANKTSEEVYYRRIELMLRDPDTLFAVKTGLHVSEPMVIATCAAALGFAGAALATVELEWFLKLLEHEHVAVRSNVALALYLRGGKGCPIDAAFVVLSDPDPGVRQQGALLAARVLKQREKEAGYATALLSYFESLSDFDENVRVNVAQGMAVIANPAAASVLVERGLNDRAPRVRYAAAQSLAALRPAAEAEAVLAALKREFNRFVQRELVGALQAITGLDITAIPQWESELPAWRNARENPSGRAPPANPVQAAPPKGGGAPGK